MCHHRLTCFLLHVMPYPGCGAASCVPLRHAEGNCSLHSVTAFWNACRQTAAIAVTTAAAQQHPVAHGSPQGIWKPLSGAWQHTLRSWWTYVHQPALPAALACGMLHLTVMHMGALLAPSRHAYVIDCVCAAAADTFSLQRVQGR